MNAWIPVIQTLIWPLLIGAICYWLRSEVMRLVKALVTRIEDGDSIEAGTSGLKLGASQSTPPEFPNRAGTASTSVIYDETIPHEMYLLHTARRDTKLDKNGQEYYRLRIWIDSDDPQLLHQVHSVTYHLHSSFENPIRTVEAPERQFELATSAWGQFLVYATVQFKNEKTALKIERYLDF